MRRFGLALVTTGVFLAVAAAPAAASGVSIKAKPTTMVYGVGGTISGGLTTPGTFTKFVLLQSTFPYSSANFKPIAEQPNSSGFGKYSFKVKPTATARYRVEARGELGASSASLRVFVKRRIVFRGRRLSIAQARFSGWVLPNQSVWVHLQVRQQHGVGHFHDHLTIRARAGQFAAKFGKTVRVSPLQDWRIRVFEAHGDVRGFVMATSQVITT